MTRNSTWVCSVSALGLVTYRPGTPAHVAFIISCTGLSRMNLSAFGAKETCGALISAPKRYVPTGSVSLV